VALLLRDYSAHKMVEARPVSNVFFRATTGELPHQQISRSCLNTSEHTTIPKSGDAQSGII
jgi:hypothetical protein